MTTHHTYAPIAPHGTVTAGHRVTPSVHVREVTEFANRAFSRSRKVYGVAPQLVSECRNSGGPLLKAHTLMDCMTPAHAQEYAAMVQAWADARTGVVECLDTVLDAAQLADSEEDIWERRYTSDRAHRAQYTAVLRHALATARIALLAIEQEGGK